MANQLNGQEILDKPIITNETDKTLSGTPKVITVKDNDGTEYYWKVYPTKA
ncbi:MAG: hypothetical protein A4E72_01401 [Syntrophus sp. PtaU1.Bin208]|nr:MAG: hypothetical protein A4E72_01401 [Syntrophus sp. PtaU1.Bin208]